MKLPRDLEHHASLNRAFLAAWDVQERPAQEETLERLFTGYETLRDDALAYRTLCESLEESGLLRLVEFYERGPEEPPKEALPRLEKAQRLRAKLGTKKKELVKLVEDAERSHQYILRTGDGSPTSKELQERVKQDYQHAIEALRILDPGAAARRPGPKRTERLLELAEEEHAYLLELKKEFLTPKPGLNEERRLERIAGIRQEIEKIATYAVNEELEWKEEAERLFLQVNNHYDQLQRRTKDKARQEELENQRRYTRKVAKTFGAFVLVAAAAVYFVRYEAEIKHYMYGSSKGVVTEQADPSRSELLPGDPTLPEKIETLESRLRKSEERLAGLELATRERIRPYQPEPTPPQRGNQNPATPAPGAEQLPRSVAASIQRYPGTMRVLYVDKEANRIRVYERHKKGFRETYAARSSDGHVQGAKQREWDNRTPEGDFGVKSVEWNGAKPELGNAFIRIDYHLPGNGISGNSVPERDEAIKNGVDCTYGGIITTNRDIERIIDRITGHESRTRVVIESPRRG